LRFIAALLLLLLLIIIIIMVDNITYLITVQNSFIRKKLYMQKMQENFLSCAERNGLDDIM
jgi:hypothetical protein